jgi:hypothetical protein
VLLIVAGGVYPKPMLDRIAPSVDRVLRVVDQQFDHPVNPDAKDGFAEGKETEKSGSTAEVTTTLQGGHGK